MTVYQNAEDGMTLGELAQKIGLQVIKTAAICQIGGWSTPASAATYMHGKALESLIMRDFIAWTRGDKTAGARLTEFGEEVGLGPAGVMNALSGYFTSLPEDRVGA